MKKLLFLLLLSFSLTASAQTCRQVATKLATEINGIHKNGGSVADIRKRFEYSQDLADLAAIYMTAIIEMEPKRGWTKDEYVILSREFAKEICTRTQK